MKNLSRQKLASVRQARVALQTSGTTLRAARKEIVALCYDEIIHSSVTPATRNQNLLLLAELMADDGLYAMVMPFCAEKPHTHFELRWSIVRLLWREWHRRELALPYAQRDSLANDVAWRRWDDWAKREGWDFPSRMFEKPRR